MKLDELLKITEDLKAEVQDLKWVEDDVRHSFYPLLYSSLYSYYIGQISYEISHQIGRRKIGFDNEIVFLKPHVSRLYEVAKIPTLTYSFQAEQNRSVLLGSWTSFETCVNLIFDYISDDEILESLIKKINSKLLRALNDIDAEKKSEIIQVLKDSAFIPIWRKFETIAKRNKIGYGEKLSSDRQFLQLITTIRNSIIHSNSIYYGKPMTFTFDNVKFIFEDGKFYKQDSPRPDVTFKMAIELKKIFTRLTNCLDDIELIEYPKNENENGG